MDSPFQRELTYAIAAVQLASRLSKLVLEDAASNSVDHVSKDDLSPVTMADFAAQAILTATLSAAFPDDAFVGEESADELRSNPTLLFSVYDYIKRLGSNDKTLPKSPSGEIMSKTPRSPEHACELIDLAGKGNDVPHSGRVWVFDPIDGTQTFLRGEIYAINVCLLVDGQQTVAVVALPNLALDATPPVHNTSIDSDPQGGSILYGVKGHGSFARPLAGAVDLAGKRLSQHEREPRDLRLVTSTHQGSTVPGVHEKICDKLGIQYPGNNLLGWVARWAALALGFANVTFWVYTKRERLAKIWDHAGAMLLFEEAGGIVTDVDGKPADLVAGRHMVANFGWVAAPAGVHGKVLEAVREGVREIGMEHLLR